MKRLTFCLVMAALAAASSSVAFAQVEAHESPDLLRRVPRRMEMRPPERLPPIVDSRPIFASLDEPEPVLPTSSSDRDAGLTSAPNAEANQPAGLAPAPQAQPGGAPSLIDELMKESPRSFGYSGAGVSRSCADMCEPAPLSLWYVNANAVMMARDRGNRAALTQNGIPPVMLMNSQDATTSFEPGWELHLGRRFGDGEWTFEASFWTIDGFTATRDILGGSLDAALPTDGLDFGGIPGDNYFTDAQWQRIYRHNEVDNIELNLIRNRLTESCGPWTVDSFLGVRYFRFHERLRFDSYAAATGLWASLDHALDNNLIGVQFGFDLGLDLGYNLKLTTTPRLGLFDNHIAGRYSAYLGDGTVATGLPIASNEDVFSVMGQMDIALDWQVRPNWSLFLGYRFLAATGIALGDEQFTINPSNTAEIARIPHNGSLLLHGAFAGLRISF
jgi:hypothetical protein